MSVVGFDIGTQKCTIAVAKGGGIEIVLNEESDRFTPSCLAFGERLRYVGTSAKQHMATNPQSCVFDVKRMIGRPLSDPLVEKEKHILGCELVSGVTGEVAAKVNYMNDKHEFSMTQLMAMLLVKLKSAVEIGLGIKSMKDCVISVPCFFTDIERQCMLNAAAVAGLNCLKLLNETTAVALCYGIFRTDFPPDTSADTANSTTTPPTNAAASPQASVPAVKSKIVAFIDIGYAASQLSIVAFNAGKLKVLANVYDSELGGRDFDLRLFQHFCAEFKTKYKVDVMSKRRAQLRLLTECERLKKLMSANSSAIPMNIDSLIDDRDVSSSMKRTDFEALCEDLLVRVENVVQAMLKQSGLKVSEIDDVEIIGGCTRLPAVRERIKTVFGREPSTTINADEAVARGCAIQCAILSPNFRVREFAVTDCLQYPITIHWDKTADNEENEMVIFNKSDKIPASKLVTLNKSAPFRIFAKYTNPDEVPHPCKSLGSYLIRDIPPNSTKVKVKVRMSRNGLFQLAEATAYEKVVETIAQPEQTTTPGVASTENNVESPKGQSVEQGGEANGGTAQKEAEAEGASMDTSNIDGVEANGTPHAPQPTQKVKSRAHDLPFDTEIPGVVSEITIRDFIERENAIQAQNKLERDRVDAKNAVEEYVLNINRELSESLQPYASPEEAKTLSELCDATNNWLYDEGEDQPKSVYNERLAQLTKIGDPIRRRHHEHQYRQPAFDQLGRVIMHFRKIVDNYKNKDDKYAHIDAADMEKVEKYVAEKQAWFDEKQSKQIARKLFEDPIVFADQIAKEAEFLEKACNPTVNRPKPKPPSPPPAPAPAADGEASKASADTPKEASQPAATASAVDANGMELD